MSRNRTNIYDCSPRSASSPYSVRPTAVGQDQVFKASRAVHRSEKGMPLAAAPVRRFIRNGSDRRLRLDSKYVRQSLAFTPSRDAFSHRHYATRSTFLDDLSAGGTLGLDPVSRSKHANAAIAVGDLRSQKKSRPTRRAEWVIVQ